MKNYWYHEGNFIKVFKHINHAWELFPREEIESLFNFHGERYGQEGKARDILLLKMFSLGYLRLTYDTRKGLYHCQGLKGFLSENRKEYLRKVLRCQIIFTIFVLTSENRYEIIAA